MLISLLLWPPRRRPNTTGSSRAGRRAEHGPDTVSLGFPMASDRGPVPRSTRRTAGRTAARRVPAVSGGHPVGARQRRPLERFTRTVPQSLYVLASAARVGGRRTLSGRLASAAGPARPAQASRLGRCDGRWLVCTGKKGGPEVGYGRKGKGTTIMLMIDGEGTPLSAFTTAASTSEVHAIETLVDERATRRPPERLMYDKAADADWLRESLDQRGVALICPHRATGPSPRFRTAAPCGATNAVTKSNAPLAGCITSDA